jgi:uncharacterized protein (TIGR01777 family)
MAQGGKRIIVTGATGFLGSRIIKLLSRRGDQVVALVRDIERGRRLAPGAAEYLSWSSSMKDGDWARAIDGADAVINLAGTPVAERWSDANKKKMRESRLEGTRHIVEAIGRAASKPRVLVNASGVGYYGTSDSKIFTENSPAGTDFLAKLCAEWEAEALKAEEHGVRTVIVRTGIVLDPHGGALARLLPTFRLFVGGPVASGKQWFPWVHIDDEIAIYLWAIDNEEVRGAVNAAAPGVVNSKEFSATLGKVLGRPSFFPVPKFAIDLILGEGSLILIEGQRVVPERTQALGFEFRHPELREALESLLKK